MSQKIKYTVIHRILHWVMALAMPILFITGFLRMYWMNKNRISGMLENSGTMTAEEATTIAISIREPMWEWHIVFAYVMVLAFIIRIVYMLARGIRFPNPFGPHHTIKEKLQGYTYIYFYLFVFISAFTGISIYWDLFSAYHESIETIHKWGLYWFPIFIILHFAGILVAELTRQKGIASKMIGGD